MAVVNMMGVKEDVRVQMSRLGWRRMETQDFPV